MWWFEEQSFLFLMRAAHNSMRTREGRLGEGTYNGTIIIFADGDNERRCLQTRKKPLTTYTCASEKVKVRLGKLVKKVKGKLFKK